jgi:methionyl-tRNA formyltransferase
MRLDDVALVLAPTVRSRAYVQALMQRGLVPGRAYLLPGTAQHSPVDGEISLELRPDGGRFNFRPNADLIGLLHEAGIRFEELPSADINGEACRETLQAAGEDMLVYSGLGGVLLKDSLLGIGKKFIHVHGGYAPQYRGSTAFYFSFLEQGVAGATAMILDNGIDTGAVIKRRQYRLIPGLSIDYVLDPSIRADLLVDVLGERAVGAAFDARRIENEVERTYFVIHPVLKHIALQRNELVESI